MSWERKDVFTTAEVPDQTNAVKVASRQERAVLLEAHSIDWASVTLLDHHNLFLFNVPKSPSLIM